MTALSSKLSMSFQRFLLRLFTNDDLFTEVATISQNF